LSAQAISGHADFHRHDVYFIRALAQTVLHISAGKLTPTPAIMNITSRNRERLRKRPVSSAGEQLTDSRPAEAPWRSGPRAALLAKPEQKRKEAEERQAVSAARKKAQAHLEQIEREIAALEKRHKESSRCSKARTYGRAAT